MIKVQAHIASLDGAMAEVTIQLGSSDSDCIAIYNGKKCTAIYNCWSGYYVDDLYGVIEEE